MTFARWETAFRAVGRVWTTDHANGEIEFPLPNRVTIGVKPHADPSTPQVTGMVRLLGMLERPRREDARAYASVGLALDTVGDNDLAERMSVSVPLPRACSTFGLGFDRPICWLSSVEAGTDVTTARSGEGLLEVRSEAQDGVEWHFQATSSSVPYLRTMNLHVTASTPWPARQLMVTLRSDARVGPALNLDLRLEQLPDVLDEERPSGRSSVPLGALQESDGS